MKTIEIKMTVTTEKNPNELTKLIMDVFGSGNEYKLATFELSTEETEKE